MEERSINALRILVVSSAARRAESIAGLLRDHEVAAEACANLGSFTASLKEGAGAGVIADQAVIADGIGMLAAALSSQPPWSDIPLIVLVAGGREASESNAYLVQTLGPLANATLLERPVRPPTLMSAVRAALRARRRQYELRNYLIERQQNEEKLRETAKLESLGVLAGGIAHDFNNLLVGVMGNASLALDSMAPDDRNRVLLENVVRASERAADLTRQLLAYSGRGAFVIQKMDLSKQIREIVRLMNTSVAGSVELRLDLAEVAPIEADESQIHQLVMNLVINAVESIGDGSGTVTVRTRVHKLNEQAARENGGLAPGAYVCLEVADTGAGMAEQIKARIFDPFFTTKFTGRGLGLSAVLGIVRSHRGHIRVESAPGEGSTFIVFFPVAARHAGAHAGQLAAGADLRGYGTVLVVDDEEIVRATARRSLERYGYTVLEAKSGPEAVSCIRKAVMSLVLLDLTMPAMSGEETFRRLREIQPGVPVVLSSGLTEAEAERKFAGQGLAGFIQKPYTASALAEKVKSAATAKPKVRGAGPPL